MRKWSLVISLFYAVVVLVLLLPAAVGLAEEHPSPADIYTYSKQMYAYWFTWVWLGILIVGQFLLLGLTVDTTERRLKPRTHILVSSITTGLLLAMLMITGACSLAVAIKGDRLDDWAELVLLGGFVLPWLVWGILFYRFARGSSYVVTRAVRWLFRGSVLELLVAVPSHVIVRRRHDCCAPGVTAIGIATGIAIMLLSFGPSVLLLYQKRMESLRTRTARAHAAP